MNVNAKPAKSIKSPMREEENLNSNESSEPKEKQHSCASSGNFDEGLNIIDEYGSNMSKDKQTLPEEVSDEEDDLNILVDVDN